MRPHCLGVCVPSAPLSKLHQGRFLVPAALVPVGPPVIAYRLGRISRFLGYASLEGSQGAPSAESLSTRPFRSLRIATGVILDSFLVRSPAVTEKEETAMKVSTFYSRLPGTRVYHDNSLCAEGNNIEHKNRIPGTDSLPKCKHCNRLP